MRIILAVSMLTLTVLVTGTTYAGAYEEAVDLIEKKKYAVANTLLTAMLAKKDSVRVRYALGYCAEKQNQKAAALKHYKKAIILNTNAGNRVSNRCGKGIKTSVRPGSAAVPYPAEGLGPGKPIPRG